MKNRQTSTPTSRHHHHPLPVGPTSTAKRYPGHGTVHGLDPRDSSPPPPTNGAGRPNVTTTGGYAASFTQNETPHPRGSLLLGHHPQERLAVHPLYATSSNLPQSVPHYPEEDSKLRATSLKIRRGGNCPNSLEVLQQLLGGHDHVRPYLVSCLPEQSSPATRRVIASFGSNTRVDFRHCIYRQGHTEAASSYIIRSEGSGSRTLVNYNDLPEMTTREFEDIVRSFSADQDTWWHFEVSSRPQQAATPARLYRI